VIDDEEKPPTEDELREAAALARALDGAPAEGPAAPADALEAAALLRASGGSLELDPARSAEIRAGLQRQLRPVAPSTRWARAVVGLSSLAAAALVVVLSSRVASPPALEARALPRPSPALVGAQLSAIRHPSAPNAELDQELHRYRETLFAELERRHGGRR
jgi:hypothetical protein